MIVIMLNRFFIITSLLAVFLIKNANVVYAQECNINYEMITKLYKPNIGAYSVWERNYGLENKNESFVSAINYGENGVLVAGEVISLYGKNKSPSIVLVNYDKRGQKIWEKHHFVSGIDNIVKMLPYSYDGRQGAVMLANRFYKSISKKVLWIGFFDENGNLKSQKNIIDDKHNLLASDFSHDADGRGFVVPVTIEREFGRGNSSIIYKNAVIYLLDKYGNKISSRGYIVGTNNEIMGLSVAKFKNGGDGYIATGYFENPHGKKIAWVLRLAKDLSFIWQKEYSRGLSAKINNSVVYDRKNILIFGDIVPAGEGAVGSWLALIDSIDGEIIWQRYYYGETGYHDYLANGLYVNDDRLITILMMANPVRDAPFDYMSYAHVLNISPRGITLGGDAYYNGKRGYINQILESVKGHRIMVGNAIISIKDFKTRNNKDKKDEEDLPPPLKDFSEVVLPDAPLSKKAKIGLAMLKNKIKDQGYDVTSDISYNDGHDIESANISGDFTQNGWVLIGNMPNKYTAPCDIRVRNLN